MLDKLWLVRKRSVGQNIQLYVIPIMSLIVMFLFYGAFQAGDNKWESSGILELVFLPVALLFLLISGAVTLVAEKAARLVETMKIMSLKMDVYVSGCVESNFGRPTPSTRRSSVAPSARWRGDSTPLTRRLST